ncbi:hypothetical protein NC651_009862 [Populus alba x Populus x berolinensis]|nr:hypothetical protein NC651_009862 [Populus alba x Populus x berolinensis]
MMMMSMNMSSSSVQVQMQVAVPFHFEKCQSMSQLRQYHSQIIRLGLSSHNHLIPPLINFCARASSSDALTYALKLFDSIPQPDAFLYNTIIKGFLHSQLLPSNSILLLYSHMLQNSVLPNNFTFPSLLRACRKIQHGLQIHAHLFKFGFGAHSVCLNSLIHMYVTFQALEEARRVFHTIPHPDSVSWTSLISGYSKWGLIDEAFSIFQLMPQKNSASWNAMMAAYVQTNRFHEAFALFDRMKAENNNVLDKFVATTMLSACTGLGALEQGKWIHEYIKRNGIELDSKLATAIVDMYCKCGCLEKALQVFHSLPLPCRWISSWNCMIGGLAMHGNGEAAIQLFKEMERQMVVPDDITFLNLLTACAHSGLVEEGRNYFSYMIRVYGIEPRMEHFGCMVDLLGRAGMVQEARKLIDEMPVSPDVTVLGTLLGACKKHRNIELGEEIGRRVIELEPNNSGRYVLLANLYANAGKWEDVAKVRKLMDDRGVKKAPGFSMIELQGTVHEFIAGERNHPQAKELHAKVYEMLENLKSVGYVADTNGVLHGHDFDEEDGENPLYYHSEKLAIAFGLSRTKPGETLRILKNLRICEDCHHACKLISTVFDREIIVRDRTRFHLFKMGQCSCEDYW